MFKAIAAMSENRVIGSNGKIPWHLPEDFKWFKRTTWGKTVLMGRRTFESLGKPLPNRINVVLTRNPMLLSGEGDTLFKAGRVGPVADKILRQAAFRAADTQAALPGIESKELETTELVLRGDIQSLRKFAGELEVWVIGGSSIYQQMLPECSDLFLTRVKRTVSGDALFPPFEADFVLLGTVLETAEFAVEHYQHRNRLLA